MCTYIGHTYVCTYVIETSICAYISTYVYTYVCTYVHTEYGNFVYNAYCEYCTHILHFLFLYTYNNMNTSTYIVWYVCMCYSDLWLSYVCTYLYGNFVYNSYCVYHTHILHFLFLNTYDTIMWIQVCMYIVWHRVWTVV